MPKVSSLIIVLVAMIYNVTVRNVSSLMEWGCGVTYTAHSEPSPGNIVSFAVVVVV